MNFLKRDRRPKELLPAAEQLSSSTVVAAEQQTDEQMDGTTKHTNEAPVLGPKGTSSSSCWGRS